MGRNFVYSILAVLLIAGNSSMAFLVNIHEKMTVAERLAIFGSEDSVPEYEVFPISLPGARQRRNADKNINLEFAVDGKTIIVNLKPTKRYLASKHTPVWLAQSDEHAYKKIRYDPLPKAMSDIGEFQMYHDKENDAAVIVYEDPAEGSVIEGIVTAYYGIRSLPRRLTGELQKIGAYVVKTPAWGKRSISSDAEDDKNYFVVFKIATPPKEVISSLIDPDNLQRQRRARDREGKRKVPRAVYPEILIVLDYTAIRSQNLTQVLRFTLAFWNGVDLIYRALDEPKVYLNIAGVIISGHNSTTPYIGEDVLIIGDVFADNLVSEMGKYFYKEKTRFPTNRYDIIVAMTTIPLVLQDDMNNEYGVDGYNAPNASACHSTSTAFNTKTIKNAGIIHYYWQFSGVRTAAHTIARLLGVKRDVINGTAPECASEDGNIMAEELDVNNQKMQWSTCSRKGFSRFLSCKKSVCLQNKPLWINQADKVLPGRWLTLDGQCKNEGYAKACTLKKFSTCAAKGCRAKKSRKCVRTESKPLPGSTCGTNKHCSTKKKCIRD